MADIFLSYSSTDRPWVQVLAQMLNSLGWTTWWDRKIPVGKSFHTVLEEEIDAAKCIVVVWTPESVSSDWVRTEAEEGKRRNILVPITLHKPRVPLGFRHLQAADLDGWNVASPNAEFDGLLTSIKLIAPQARAKTIGTSSTALTVAAHLEPKGKSEPAHPSAAKKRAPSAAFMKPMTPSPQLAAIIGSKPLNRTQVTEKVWEYIKKHGLQDKVRRTMINPDQKLGELFGGISTISMFGMTKEISKHLK